MTRGRILVASGIAGVAIVVGIVVYLFASIGTDFDYSKVSVFDATSNKEYLTQQVVRSSVDASLSHPSTKLFLANYDNPELRVYVRFLTASEVDNLSQQVSTDDLSRLAFLPESSPALVVFFDSRPFGVPEQPTLAVYLEPESYRIYGVI